MTDITELVKRLREHADGLSELYPDTAEAADALEAQAKRIAGLEYEAKLFDEALGVASARIAELEAALNGWQEWWELRWEDRRPDVAERRYRAARAALNGEKG